jgi:hypothetical protein
MRVNLGQALFWCEWVECVRVCVCASANVVLRSKCIVGGADHVCPSDVDPSCSRGSPSSIVQQVVTPPQNKESSCSPCIASCCYLFSFGPPDSGEEYLSFLEACDRRPLLSQSADVVAARLSLESQSQRSPDGVQYVAIP